MAEEKAAKNTDIEIWRKMPEDYYSPSIHVTKNGGIGINVGGLVHVRPVEEWLSMVATITADRKRIEELGEQNKELRKGAQLGPIIGLEKIMEQEKTIADQTATIERLRGQLERIENNEHEDCDADYGGCTCAMRIARQALDAGKE